MGYLLPNILGFTQSKNPLLVFKSFHFLTLLVSYTQSKQFEFRKQEKSQNRTDIEWKKTSKTKLNKAIIGSIKSDTDKEVFSSWQIFKEQIKKSIRAAVIKICIRKVDLNNGFNNTISPQITKDFWPVNKLSFAEKLTDEDLLDSDLLNMDIEDILDERLNSSPDYVKEHSHDFRKSSKDSLTRSEYDYNNPFLRSESQQKRNNSINVVLPSQFEPVNGPIFGEVLSEDLLYRVLIDEDKLENRNIMQYFDMDRDSLDLHLLLLFCAHFDSLLLLMGPAESIEFLLPVYFTILNVNSIYHCNFSNIDLSTKPVGVIYIKKIFLNKLIFL